MWVEAWSILNQFWTNLKIAVFCSFHPYLFFNQDHETLTFLGFNVDANGNLFDPDTRAIIQPGMMTSNLYQDLNRQMQRGYMTLSTDYTRLSRLVFYADLSIAQFLIGDFFTQVCISTNNMKGDIPAVKHLCID